MIFRFVAILGLMLIVFSCDIFQTRDPERPTESISGFKIPDQPDYVLDNLKLAVEKHDVSNYVKCLVDSSTSTFSFTFNPSADFQGLFQSWTVEDERRYFQNLGSPVSGTPSLTFTNQVQQNSTSATTEYTMNYVLFYPHQRADVPRSFNGYMHLYLALDEQRQWSIYQWDDVRTTSDSTWSYLKAHF